MDSDSSSSHKASSEHHLKHQASPGQLLSSAKVVAEAAQSAFRHDTDKIDKAKAAGAAGDLLGAASHYAKLEEGSFGKYVNQAEEYLHKYQSPQHSSSSAHPSAASATASGSAPAAHGSGKDHSEGGGYGDYLKMAQGLLNNSSSHSSGEGNSEGGKMGDYMKLAEGFLKKH